VTTTETIRTCIQNAERQVRMFSQRIQWTPLLLVVYMSACENMHSVALGLQAYILLGNRFLMFYKFNFFHQFWTLILLVQAQWYF